MIEAGLLVHGEEIAVPYDRFRDRVMFPIHDRAGRVDRLRRPGAGAGRARRNTSIRRRRRSFTRARCSSTITARANAAHDTGELIVVEGYVDAIALSEAGFPNVVAPLGTALTADQCALLWAMAGEPILCFDGDSAGRQAPPSGPSRPRCR